MNEDDKTRIVRRSDVQSSGETIREPIQDIPLNNLSPVDSLTSIPTRIVGERSDPNCTDTARLNMPTRILERPVPADVTVLMRSSSKSSEAGKNTTAHDIGDVVGWLTIIEGPGRGRSLEIGMGQNSIGRDEGNRIQLAFGDNSLSRKNHISLVFDPRNNHFFLVSGESSNLSYIGNNPVLAPTELHPYDHIRLSEKTVVIFVPLCGKSFSWDSRDIQA